MKTEVNFPEDTHKKKKKEKKKFANSLVCAHVPFSQPTHFNVGTHVYAVVDAAGNGRNAGSAWCRHGGCKERDCQSCHVSWCVCVCVHLCALVCMCVFQRLVWMVWVCMCVSLAGLSHVPWFCFRFVRLFCLVYSCLIRFWALIWSSFLGLDRNSSTLPLSVP